MVPFDNISTRVADHRDPNRFSDKINKKVWFNESVRLVTVTLYMTSGLSHIMPVTKYIKLAANIPSKL